MNGAGDFYQVCAVVLLSWKWFKNTMSRVL